MYITPFDGFMAKLPTLITKVKRFEAYVSIFIDEEEFGLVLKHPGPNFDEDWMTHVKVDDSRVERAVRIYAVTEVDTSGARLAISRIKLADDFDLNLVVG